MTRRRRRTLEERIAAAEEQLEALPKRQRLTYREHRAAQNSRRLPQREAAWQRLSVAEKVKHKRRDLTRLIDRWERRNEERARYVGQRIPYHIRLRFDESHYWHSRLRLEADIQELEGAPPERIVKLRWAENESFRRGKRVSADEYPVPAAVPAAAPEKNARPEPREWRPKSKERDRLADYTERSSFHHPRLEPEFV
jgi:hypothetical protein